MGINVRAMETKTSEITLRPIIVPSDVNDFMEFVTDEKVNKFYDYGTFTSKASVKEYMDSLLYQPYFRAICMQNKLIGSICVSPGDESCRAVVGYAVGSKYWGKGIATKAVEMVTAKIFVEWPNLVRLEAHPDVENPGSHRVLEKAGFNKEAVLRKYYLLKGNPRDVVMYSFIPPDQQGVDGESNLNLAKLKIS